MRGEKTFVEATQGPTGKPRHKGRNREYVLHRNECLIDRYYYYSNFTDKRYEVILEALSTEFFISTRTITDLLPEHTALLQELKKKKPAITYFNNRWPHIKW